MGKNNSSEKRVVPLINYIDKDLKANLEKILALMNFIDDIGEIDSKEIYYAGYLKGEKKLPPPKEHLLWLAETNKAGRIDNLDKAKELIENCFKPKIRIPKHKYILEGYSCPDLYIETQKYIIFSEAKWTEPYVTTYTKHLKIRDQMVRHINGAMQNTNKKVIAFYIVDEKFLKNKNNHTILESKLHDPSYYEESTPYLKGKDDILTKMAESYIGYITWQQISELFEGIEFPDEVK